MIEHNPDLGLGILFVIVFVIAMLLMVATAIFDYKFKKSVKEIQKNKVDHFKNNIK